MAAKKSAGGSVGRRRAKDSAMAAYMKLHKVERKTFREPIGHKLVSLNSNIFSWGRK